MAEWRRYVINLDGGANQVVEARVHDEIGLLEWRCCDDDLLGDWQGGTMRSEEPIAWQLQRVLDEHWNATLEPKPVIPATPRGSGDARRMDTARES